MGSNPEVSIIIPVYNGSNYLREAIDSAIAQSYKNIEIIVVNDGSDDQGKTEQIAKLYGDRIRYFYKQNGGVASALNYGIREMKGQYFAWLSHDDVYYPNKIERHLEYVKNSGDKNLVTFCDHELIDEKARSLDIVRLEPHYLKSPYLMILSTRIGGCSYLVPKSCFDKAGLFNEKLKTTQDNDMWLRIAKEGFRFEYISEVLVRFRLHPAQDSRKLIDTHKEERDEFFQWAVSFIGMEVHPLFSELIRDFAQQGCYAGLSALLKLKYRGNIFRHLAFLYAFFRYRIMKIFKHRISTTLRLSS